MLDVFLKLLEKLAAFAELREKNREKFIDRYVAPLYNDAEIIYRDYSQLLRDIRKRAERAVKVAPLLKYIEDKRRANLTTRTKVRAVLTKCLEAKNLSRFEMGIFGLMTGSMTALDEGHCSFAPLANGDHTILDIVRRLANRGQSELVPYTRENMLRYIDGQIKGIDSAWSEVVAGYADLMATVIPTETGRKTPMNQIKLGRISNGKQKV